MSLVGFMVEVQTSNPRNPALSFVPQVHGKHFSLDSARYVKVLRRELDKENAEVQKRVKKKLGEAEVSR
jgi:hypothetical protein